MRGILTIAFGLVFSGQLAAQTFTVLHSFTATPADTPFTNTDGAFPYAGVTLSSNTLYGATTRAGHWENGTLFKMKTDGTDFTVIHHFSAAQFDPVSTGSTNTDGAFPYGTLVFANEVLYGTTLSGGSFGDGTVFRINSDGTGFQALHHFGPISRSGSPATNEDGAFPKASLVLDGDVLYGTTELGGINASGIVFRINIDGSGFTNLHSFISGDIDGARPVGNLLLVDSTLYGTTAAYGTTNYGTVFAINLDGSEFRNVHVLRGNEAAFPYGGLVFEGGTFYGTTIGGGSSFYGTVFAIDAETTHCRTLHSFTVMESGTNMDGALPYCSLIFSNQMLYGTAELGGERGSGTVFAVNADGTRFVTLHTFSLTSDSRGRGTNVDGSAPDGPLVRDGNTLYGTAKYGGQGGSGTAFSLSFVPQLTIIPYGTSVIITWPTNFAGFDYMDFILQSTTNLTPPTSWTPASSMPVVIGGQRVVIDNISANQRFYRLAQ